MANSTKRRSGAKSRSSQLKAVRVQQFDEADQQSTATPELHPAPVSKDKSRKKPPFPLWLHSGTGQWTKKIRGQHFYFGTDKDAALNEYLRVKDDLQAGRIPPLPENDLVTIKLLGDTFLTHKKHQVTIGELTQASFNDYEDTCQRLADNLGKSTAVQLLRPDDLLKYRHKLAKTWGPNTLGNEINRCRVVLRFAFENGLIDRPVRLGEFKRPSKAAIRRRRAEVGPRLFEANELRTIIDCADDHMRAMIYLGINCGFGNADCGVLPRSALDLDGGWIDFPRRKTGVPRRCPLWAETVAALRGSIAIRKTSSDEQHSGLVFITKYGQPWYVDGASGSPLSAEFRKLLNSINVYKCKKCGVQTLAQAEPKKCPKCGKKLGAPEQEGIRRPGLSFYTLRHTFQTIGDETGDYLAVRRVMGHSDSSISDHYRERFQDERLQNVVDHVHDWLFKETDSMASTAQ